ncbi:MAG: DNA polymerase III subunit delta, partial [Clostridia bacterium]|nr:DNA polymerase III subunit delta [Clostridia bacterium]
MTYDEFMKAVNSNSALPSVLLFSGEEEKLKQYAYQKLRAALIPEGMESLNESVFEGTCDVRQLDESVGTLPFMTGKRLVVLRDSPLVAASRGSQDEAAISKMIDEMPDTTCLVFYVTGKADLRRTISKKIIKLGGNVDFDELDLAALTRWCNAKAKSMGKVLYPGAVAQISSLVGNLLLDVGAALDKVFDYTGNRAEVTAADISAVVQPTLESSIFKITDSVIAGNTPQALQVIKQQLEANANEIQILSLLASAFRRLLLVKTIGGNDRAKIAQALKVSPGFAGVLVNQARNISALGLKNALEACTQAVENITSGRMKAQAALYDAVFTAVNETE